MGLTHTRLSEPGVFNNESDEDASSADEESSEDAGVCDLQLHEEHELDLPADTGSDHNALQDLVLVYRIGNLDYPIHEHSNVRTSLIGSVSYDSCL